MAVLIGQITSIEAVGQADSITLTATYDDPHDPNGLHALQVGSVVFYAATVHDFAQSQIVAFGPASGGQAIGKHMVGSAASGEKFWYWARTRNNAGDTYGDLWPGDLLSPDVTPSATVFSDTGEFTEFSVNVTVTSLSGPPTTYSVESARYQRLGTRCMVNVHILISVNGPAATNIIIQGLPFTAHANNTTIGAGVRSDVSTNKMCACYMFGGVDQISVLLYDGTYPGGNNVHLYVDVEYEVEPNA